MPFLVTKEFSYHWNIIKSELLRTPKWIWLCVFAVSIRSLRGFLGDKLFVCAHVPVSSYTWAALSSVRILQS